MEKPHIGISYEEGIPSEVFNEFNTILESEKLNIMLEAREPLGPMATYEWLIPTAVIAYIGKSYFDSFLQEMGKDHYQLLKKAFASLRKKLVGEEAPQVTIISSPGKVTKSNKYSLIFSIVAESGDRFSFKLLIQKGASKEDYEKIISSFIEFLERYHSGTLNNEIVKNVVKLGAVGGTVLCAYDFEGEKLLLLDPRAKQDGKNA